MIRLLLVMLLPALSLACGRAPDPVWRGQVAQFELNVPGESQHDPPLIVGTYNLHGLQRPDELRAELSDCGAAVWAFQEVNCKAIEPSDIELQFHAILPPGRWWVATLPLNSDDAGWESQAIASRFPIRSAECWNLRGTGSKRRAALAATIEADVGNICVINTDHQVSYFDMADGNGRQVQGLSQRLGALRIDRVIVAGDFNTTGNLWRLRTSAGDVAALNRVMQEADLMSLPVRTTADSTFRVAGLTLQLDQMYFRGLRCIRWMTLPSGGSDHRALIATFATP